MYLKGTLHTHTLASDGDSSPEKAAQYYKSLGYDFMFFTDHETNFPIKDYIKCPIDDFLPISGAEFGYRFYNHFKNYIDLHMCGLGYVGDYIPPKETKTIPQMIDEIIKEYKRLGAIPMVNHPNWGGDKHGFSFNYAELKDVHNPFLLEIVNYSDGGYNEGNEAFESVEYTWDVLLSYGKTVYGTMTDDTHVYAKEKNWYKNAFLNTSNHFIKYVYKSFLKCHTPGNGFVMVNAELNEESIKNALRKGDFYASNGLLADFYEVTDRGIKVKIQKQDNENTRIIFKGKMGLPLKIVDGEEGEYKFTCSPDEQYIRVKAINGAFKTALFQPVFRDGRKTVII